MASFDPALLRSSGVEVLHALWSHDISAELAKDSRSPEDLLQKHRDENYSWIIIIKPESMLKIKTLGRKDIPDSDIQASQLLSWMRAEIHKRDARGLARAKAASSHSESSAAGPEREHEQEVKVLVAQTRSKKFNRRTVVEQAQVDASNLVRSFLEGPILAVETSDQIMDLIRETTLSDPESWKKVDHSVTNLDKKYVREIHDQLDTWKFAYERKGATRHSFLYNFRNGNCMYYDLGL